MERNSGAEISNIIKENTQELQDYLKDLDRWETEVKKKDQELIKISENSNLNNTQQLPPVRNSNKTTGGITEILKGDEQEFSSKMDEGVESGSDESDSTEEEDTGDEEFEQERRKQRAIQEKDKGNEYFKKGKYQEAITCYTRGIHDDPTNYIIPANRAMALMKLGQLAAAEKDCTQSISIDHTYVKAFHRRGTCRLALKKYQLARQDFLKVLEMDPNNKQATMELEKINEEFKKRDKLSQPIVAEKLSIKLPSSEESKESSQKNELEGIIFPIEKDLESRSKKPLRRIKIVDIPAKEDSIKLSSSLTSETSKIVNSKSSSVDDAIIPATIVAKTVEKAKETQIGLGPSPEIPPVPINSFQFERDWRILKYWPETQYKYLMNFPPENFPTIFKNAIETEIFTGILKTLGDNYKGEVELYVKYLTNLSKVGRFSTIIMFLSEEEQKEISDMILKVGEKCSSQEKETLTHLYNVTF